MKKISVAIATFNEEENIKPCLEAVKDWVSEIVVVDGGSTDKTIAVAEKYGAKVTTTDNPPIFHINKQKAIDQCSGDWVLQLDADEIVTSELQDEIKKIIKQDKAKAGYYLPRRNYFLGRWMKKGGLYPDNVIRFFKKGKARLPCKSVHEQMAVDGEIGYLKNELIHNPFPSFSEYLNKANRYSSLLAEEYAKKHLKTNIFALIKYLFVVPGLTFINLYFRNLGLLDGFPGFVFALFSALQKKAGYVKYWELVYGKKIH